MSSKEKEKGNEMRDFSGYVGGNCGRGGNGGCRERGRSVSERGKGCVNERVVCGLIE